MHEISITEISPWKLNPRSVIQEDSLAELAESIKEVGVIQPITVRPVNGETDELVRKLGAKYVIVAGERRYRAACIAGLETVPAIVKEISREQALEIAIIENLQRDDISAIEEARAYQTYLTETGIKQTEFAQKIGKSQSYIANRLRLLKLPEEIQDKVISGEINKTAGRELCKIFDLPGGIEKAIELKEKGWEWEHAIETAGLRIRQEISNEMRDQERRKQVMPKIEKALKDLRDGGKTAYGPTDEKPADLESIYEWDVGKGCKKCERVVYLVDVHGYMDGNISVNEKCPDPQCYAERKKVKAAEERANTKKERDELRAKNLPRKTFVATLIDKLGKEYEFTDTEVRYIAHKVIPLSYGAESMFKKLCEAMGWDKTEGVAWSTRVRMGIDKASTADLLKAMVVKLLIDDEKLASERNMGTPTHFKKYLEERGFEA